MRRNEFIEVTNLRDEKLLLNPDNIVKIEECDNGCELIFSVPVTTIGAYEQKNFMYVKESYPWLKYELTGHFTDGQEPERYPTDK